VFSAAATLQKSWMKKPVGLCRPYVQIREFGNRSVDHVKTPVAGWKVEQIGTFNGLSPFIAPLSRRLSFGMAEFEFSFDHLFP
jgi:hypothetical protein